MQQREIDRKRSREKENHREKDRERRCASIIFKAYVLKLLQRIP